MAVGRTDGGSQRKTCGTAFSESESDGAAKSAEQLPARMIFAVGIYQQVGVVQMKFAIFVEVCFINMAGEHFSEEHVVGAKLQHLLDAALDIDRTFSDAWRSDMLRGLLGEMQLCEFIHFPPGTNAADVRLARKTLK